MFAKKYRHIFTFIVIFFVANITTFSNTKAEIGYNFSTGEFINSNDKKKKKKENNTDNTNKKQQIEEKKQSNNQFKFTISGEADLSYSYGGNADEYSQHLYPNNLTYSPAMSNNHISNTKHPNNFNAVGKISFIPEFIKYKEQERDDLGKKPEVLFKTGLKFTQPIKNFSKQIDQRMMTEEYAYFDNKYIRIEGGTTMSAVAKMRVDPSSIASGIGGIYGPWWKYIRLPVFNPTGLSAMDTNALNAMSPVFILYPTLPNEAGFTTQNTLVGTNINQAMFNGGNIDATQLAFGARGQGYPTKGANSNKISIYSKRFYGFKGGFSYSPSTSSVGLLTRLTNGSINPYNNISGGDVKNYTSFAVDYRKQFDEYGIGIALFAGYEYGEPTDIKYNYNNNGGVAVIAVSSSTPYYQRHNLNAFALGGKFVWKNLSLAYSYGYWGKSLLNKYKQTTNGDYQVANQDNNSYYHSVGIGFNYGQFRAGITYMRSNFAGNKLDAWSIGIDYKEYNLKYFNLTPYIEYVGYHFHNYKHELMVGSGQYYRTIGNNGFVIQIGCKATF